MVSDVRTRLYGPPVRLGSKPFHDPVKKRRWMSYSAREAWNADFKDREIGRSEGVDGSAGGCSSSGE
jgi:hypothetical protein